MPPSVPENDLDHAIESALRPGESITWRESGAFLAGLKDVEKQFVQLADTTPARAADGLATLLAGCFERADSVDDPSGEFDAFVSGLLPRLAEALLVAGVQPDEVGRQVVHWITRDTCNFFSPLLESSTAQLSSAVRRAVAVQLRAWVDQQRADLPAESGWKDAPKQLLNATSILKNAYLENLDAHGYLSLVASGNPSRGDCLMLGQTYKALGDFTQALAWADRALLEDERLQNHGHRSAARRLKNAILGRLGRGHEAVTEAWAAFDAAPSMGGFEDLMLCVPPEELEAMKARVLERTRRADLGVHIEVCVALKRTEELVAAILAADVKALQGNDHNALEHAAAIVRSASDEATAKAFRALAMRIIDAGQSSWYGNAFDHLIAARGAYLRAGMADECAVFLLSIREHHARKRKVIAFVDRLIAGEDPQSKPRFIARAKAKWRAQ